jgi:hypothetical protein
MTIANRCRLGWRRRKREGGGGEKGKREAWGGDKCLLCSRCLKLSKLLFRPRTEHFLPLPPRPFSHYPPLSFSNGGACTKICEKTGPDSPENSVSCTLHCVPLFLAYNTCRLNNPFIRFWVRLNSFHLKCPDHE